MKNVVMIGVCLFAVTACMGQTVDSKENQINAAVQALPDDLRAEATVLGYDVNGKVVSLRKGSNQFVCLADDPNRSGFNVACYQKDLEPFMARGRELRAAGKSPSEIFDIREQEVKSGKLKMPDKTTLHILSGRNGQYNPETGKVENANYRYVVYIPYATAESTGLPTRPMKQGYPWLMDPGTHRAHIMISVPEN